MPNRPADYVSITFRGVEDLEAYRRCRQVDAFFHDVLGSLRGSGDPTRHLDDPGEADVWREARCTRSCARRMPRSKRSSSCCSPRPSKAPSSDRSCAPELVARQDRDLQGFWPARPDLRRSCCAVITLCGCRQAVVSMLMHVSYVKPRPRGSVRWRLTGCSSRC